MKQRKLFCELSPFCYRLSTLKCRAVRRLRDCISGQKFARVRQQTLLPYSVCSHKSLMRRKLGNTDMQLQENKVVNLSLAAPKVNGILIAPGEIFSFWHLVGACTAQRGYREGLTITHGTPSQDIGGGMCQFTNLIHWLVLHTPLTIVEHHHHDGRDLFPDFGRTTPFGVGTSVLYNYLDYRFANHTDTTYQLMVHTDGTYLCGEMRAAQPLCVKYHISVENERFVREGDAVFRESTVLRTCVDKTTGNVLCSECIRKNHAEVMYDTAGLSVE